jgi:hypothetical protein
MLAGVSEPVAADTYVDWLQDLASNPTSIVIV